MSASRTNISEKFKKKYKKYRNRNNKKTSILVSKKVPKLNDERCPQKSLYIKAVSAYNDLLKTNKCDIPGFSQEFLNILNFCSVLENRQWKQNEWYKFIPFFIYMQQFFQDNKVHNFRLVPFISLEKS